MSARKPRERRSLLIVDGYNVLNAQGAPIHGALSDARDALLLRLQDYAGFSGQKVILVFDAWMSDRMQRTEEEHGAVRVVYTRKGETADRYIERLCDELAEEISLRLVEVRVATSDNLEQTIILSRGATRISARELLLEMNTVCAHGRQKTPNVSRKSSIADRLPEDVRAKLEKLRHGNR